MRLTEVNPDVLFKAALNIAPFALISVFFSFARFNFGYLLGFYFYTMILGYLGLIELSKFSYDHSLAYASAFTSAIAFLIPALFIASPIKPPFVISEKAFGRFLMSIVVLASIIVGCGAVFNLRLVGLSDIYSFRNELQFPTWLEYAMGIASNVLLPFAFAYFVTQKSWWRAALTLMLLLLFYPITLSKLSLFAPGWLLLLSLGSVLFEARTTVVLSLLLPISVGVLLAKLFDADAITFQQFIAYFSLVNFRMVALPSSALDYYNDFFSTHELTYFCQVNFVKTFVNCPYREPLAIAMQNAYQIGNFNASLFATEGIASVGMIWAPISALVCGLIISLGNCLSSGLPPRFVLLSAGVLAQTFVNVPLTISFVTYGAALLFLLWFLTPRSIFEPQYRVGPRSIES
ncbi:MULTISPECIES: hypothetical protein [unclassified Bradyrhizobium]|uniref:hypothetical protein n=1 Tax=unclassified Bradyrhizobium TaxID=2631580 RepID=UPI000685AE76|nr:MULTISPECIES: hypothetical protein [unclassified Bradyrhizobium]MCP3464987.1 hypothetical protein [Bradyrhizobium sp. CCGUVB23]